MAITVLIQFSDGKSLEIKEYSTINIARNRTRVNINIANANNDLALNVLYDRIVDLQGDDETFNIAVKTESGGKAEYTGIVSDYYNSGENEILHLATKQI